MQQVTITERKAAAKNVGANKQEQKKAHKNCICPYVCMRTFYMWIDICIYTYYLWNNCALASYTVDKNTCFYLPRTELANAISMKEEQCLLN